MKKVLVLMVVAITVLALVSGCGSQRVAYFLHGTPTSTSTPTPTFTDIPTSTATATPRPTRTPVPWNPAQEGWERTPQWDGEGTEAWMDEEMQLFVAPEYVGVRFMFDIRYGHPYDYNEQQLADTLMALGISANDTGAVLILVHGAVETQQLLESGLGCSLERERGNHDTWWMSLQRPQEQPLL